MSIPDKYSWLVKPGLPGALKEALPLYGTLEAPGDADNPVILSWAREIGNKAGMLYEHDAVPWCGLFVAVCAQRAGFQLPAVAVRASSWDEWGQQGDRPRLGDVLRFERPGGGHVAFYIAEDAETYHVLGGNQSDAVNITRIAKDRCVAVRRAWPVTPAAVPVFLSAAGEISENEA